jgi:PLD-like domain
VILDLVEDGRQPGWVAAGSLRSSDAYERDGARILNVGVTRARHRAYLVTGWRSVANARPGTVLAEIHGLVGAEVKRVHARLLGTTEAARPSKLDDLHTEIWEAFAGHVVADAIYDEYNYPAAAMQAIDVARRLIWLWSPWYGARGKALVNRLRAAKDRGVSVTVFVVDDEDGVVRSQKGRHAVPGQYELALKAASSRLVHIKGMHQEILVLDEEIIFLGSFNTLSGGSRREIIIKYSGGRFATRILSQEHAEELSRPPSWPKHGQMEARRSSSTRMNRPWYWACPAIDCTERNQPIIPGTRIPSRRSQLSRDQAAT